MPTNENRDNGSKYLNCVYVVDYFDVYQIASHSVPEVVVWFVIELDVVVLVV